MEVLEYDPNNYQARIIWGNFLCAQGKLRQAAAQYNRVPPDSDLRSIAQDSLGECLMIQKDPKEAAEHFAEALRLQPDNAAIRNRLKMAEEEARSGR